MTFEIMTNADTKKLAIKHTAHAAAATSLASREMGCQSRETRSTANSMAVFSISATHDMVNIAMSNSTDNGVQLHAIANITVSKDANTAVRNDPLAKQMAAPAVALVTRCCTVRDRCHVREPDI